MMGVLANGSYRGLLSALAAPGSIHFTPSPRGMKTFEIMNCQSSINMMYPIVTIPERKLNYKFMAAETLWILKGRNDVGFLTNHCKRMQDFSDDGKILNGAYGPPFRGQLEYVVRKLIEDPDTRQAIMTLWTRNPLPSKDIPCTTVMQFFLREGTLYTSVYMRSQDVWLGWPYDVFSFSMMSAYIATMLHCSKLGILTINVGSQHLYERDLPKVIDVIKGTNGDNLAIDIYEINNPDVLCNALDSYLNAPNDTSPFNLKTYADNKSR